MGSGFVVLWMLAGLVLLVALLGVFSMQQYSRNEPIRAAAIILLPLEDLERRARNFRYAAGSCLCLYGAWKIVGHSGYVAVNGLERFGAVRGLINSSPAGDYLAFVGTLLLGAAMLGTGIFVLRGSIVALWISASVIGFDLLVSLMIGLALFGDSHIQGGLFLFLLSLVIPATTGAMVLAALQHHLLAGQKRRMDREAIQARDS